MLHAFAKNVRIVSIVCMFLVSVTSDFSQMQRQHQFSMAAPGKSLGFPVRGLSEHVRNLRSWMIPKESTREDWPALQTEQGVG